MKNYLIEIRAITDRTEIRVISVYARDVDHADYIGVLAAEAMKEDWHNGLEFYVELVTELD